MLNFQSNASLVSTHSRAEAAAYWLEQYPGAEWRFNTQPRGGGCEEKKEINQKLCVSTHSRAEAAAPSSCFEYAAITVSTHSRAEAAAFIHHFTMFLISVSTHSRAEAAAYNLI